MTDETKRSPDPIPQAYETSLIKLTRQARNIFDLKSVPYYIQSKMAEDGYCTVEDLADRWDKAEDARAQGPKTWTLRQDLMDTPRNPQDSVL